MGYTKNEIALINLISNLNKEFYYFGEEGDLIPSPRWEIRETVDKFVSQFMQSIESERTLLMTKIRSEFPQTPLNLTLREEQISIILCALENSVKYADSDYIEEVDEIFEVLETTVDKFYNKIEKARAKRPEEEW